ncbi:MULTISPECIES: glycoside hydrolase family 9 protein [unclassified Roseateles]|uniref:glycoside hydrolase family 9 protein n=1 Tax=unclassified Roseateles TaxID=2626991 RepID=UPI0009EAD6FE|nr:MULTISPECIES: glycoside hydrolase family 9 protein [unclassified Roseateles]
MKLSTSVSAGLLALAAAFAVANAHAQGAAVNQVGYLPGGAKWVVLPAGAGEEFRLVRVGSNDVVLRGRLGPAQTWAPAGQSVRLADFSALNEVGEYELRIDNVPASPRIRVAPDAYAALTAASLKAFYFNRASTALEPRHAGRWARPAGHPDTEVLVHASAASDKRPEGTRISAPKGWYDAGDYNKYVVNSGITVYTLLAAWEQFPALFKAQKLDIPESGNDLPDVLDEVLWNLDWMLAMQDPADGGVYHKLTNKTFDGSQMPHQTKGERYVVAKGTAAALDFAAVMAQASRIYKPFDSQRPGLSARMRDAAIAAWTWARANPQVVFKNPSDVRTGEYGDTKLDDEFAWAAAELYLTTGDAAYRDALKLASQPIRVPSWGDVAGLGWMSLAQHRDKLTKADAELVTKRVRGFGDELAASWKASAYRMTMESPTDFVWGSNSQALNQALMLIQAYRLSNDRAQLDAAQSVLDYVLGRNPLGMSYVTGFGQRSPMRPHHRPSEADGVEPPVPGFIVGGPNPGQQDQKNCPRYPSALPALSYIDHDCSYAANEVAINWNAPLVYVAAALQSLTPPAR